MIPVTKPYLPSIEAYQDLIKEIYERAWLTNNGPVLKRFESSLAEHLDFHQLLFVSNGTIALQLAIKALKLHGEIITTPFSYVATTGSIVWENCKPVFVDIDSKSLNIDPNLIEESISEKTTAILATHCFGNPCEIDLIDQIAKRHNLKVIYDAAHCFGAKYKGKTVFAYGDVSTTSLHATKIMHSVEGGIVFANDNRILERMAYMRNFGHDGPEKFNGVGINGKNSELHAAMGICVLDDFAVVSNRRKEQCQIYSKLLHGAPVREITIQKDCDYNYAYFPIIFENQSMALNVKNALEDQQIFPRRYFYPSLNQLDYVDRVSLPVSEKCAESILCLPLYHDLDQESQIKIAQIIKKTTGSND